MLRAGAWTHGKGRVRYRHRQTDWPAETDTGRKPFSERSRAKQTKIRGADKNRRRDKVRKTERERNTEGGKDRKRDR